MAHSDFPYEEGDVFSIATWGRLSKRDLAQSGIDVLTGMIMAYHEECQSPIHFWCARPEKQVFALAELYQASGEQGEHYIGCFFRGASFDDNGIPSIHERPSLKALFQRLEDGRVLVNLGGLTNRQSEESFGGFGLLDQRTAEYTVVTPDSVANVPKESGIQASFVLRRQDNVWILASLPAGTGVFNQCPSPGVRHVSSSTKPEPLSRVTDEELPAGIEDPVNGGVIMDRVGG